MCPHSGNNAIKIKNISQPFYSPQRSICSVDLPFLCSIPCVDILFYVVFHVWIYMPLLIESAPTDEQSFQSMLGASPKGTCQGNVVNTLMPLVVFSNKVFSKPGSPYKQRNLSCLCRFFLSGLKVGSSQLKGFAHLRFLLWKWVWKHDKLSSWLELNHLPCFWMKN